MPNSSGSQTGCIDEINAKWAAKSEEITSLSKEKRGYKTVKKGGKAFPAACLISGQPLGDF